MGNYKGDEPELKKILVSPIRIKKAPYYQFTFRYKTRDITKNYSLEDFSGYAKKMAGRPIFCFHFVYNGV